MKTILAFGRTYILWDVVEGHVWVEWFLWWCTQTLPLMYSFLTVALQPESKRVALLISHEGLWCSRLAAQLRILCPSLSKRPLDNYGNEIVDSDLCRSWNWNITEDKGLSITMLWWHNNILDWRIPFCGFVRTNGKEFSNRNVKLILIWSHKETTITEALWCRQFMPVFLVDSEAVNSVKRKSITHKQGSWTSVTCL